MQKKLTITIDEQVYNALYAVIGSGKISKFIENSIKPRLITSELEKAYLTMSKDTQREQEALEWTEGVLHNEFDK